MTLEELGYNQELENYRREHGLDPFTVGRVTAEHKERYVVKTAKKETNAEILGNLRYAAQSRSDFPAVGDWVAISEYDDGNAIIHAVFPRKSMLARQSVGTKGEQQIIATNIDAAFILQAIDRDFNINRIERYLTLCHSSSIHPIIILNKIDLVDETAIAQMVAAVQERVKQISIFAISNKSREGLAELLALIEKGKTYCLLGSSGVGKSTLLNTISGQELMPTDTISDHSERGRHVTTHRELIVLESGGIIIDNPGMREVGIADSSGGIEKTFEEIVALSENCKFKDCQHTAETGCAVIEAVGSGALDKSSYENYLKMAREKEHFAATVAEKRQKDKDFGKMVKQVKKLKGY